jgi:hypothetical protein
LNECDKRWGLNLAWIEADVQTGKGNGTKHKQVTFETASRNGEPFEEMIQKYGIPNKGYPHCTRELKRHPFDDYVRTHRLQDWYTAIGIRSDEVDRIAVKWKEEKLVYPLITMNPTKESDVNWWWSQQDFDLPIHQFEGNCTWCWKKSWRKLEALARQRPEAFDFPRKMEEQYCYARPEAGKQVFFRDSNDTDYVFSLIGKCKPFAPDTTTQRDMYWDETGGCSESCEPF